MELKFFIRLPPQGNAVLFHSTIYNLEQKNSERTGYAATCLFFLFSMCSTISNWDRKLLLLSSKLLYILGTS